MSEPREFYLWPNKAGNIQSVLTPVDDATAINDDYHATKIHVIEYEAYKHAVYQWDYFVEQTQALRAENSMMREALEFYATELNIPMAEISNHYNVSNDLGKVTHEYTSKAREALTKLSKGTKNE